MYIPTWPLPQKYKFNNKKIKFIKSKLDLIENFFKKKYNSKYCVLTSSARVGIILTLKYKKFDRSKIVKIPKWSSHCLNNSIGFVSNISCISGNKINGELLVHHLGQSFRTKKKGLFVIDDSSDSLPKKKFKPYVNSNLSEVVSLPKIIGSYSGGIILTNNYNFYNYLKNYQNKNRELASIQSQKKYDCLVLKKKNFEWHYSELENFSLDFNTCENIYENLKNFEQNLVTIKKRKELLSRFEIKNDTYRYGPCIIMKYNNKYKKIFNSYHVNIYKSLDKQTFVKRHILPIHFGISDKEIEIKLNALSKNKC